MSTFLIPSKRFTAYFGDLGLYYAALMCVIRSDEAEAELRCETYKRLRNVSHAYFSFSVKFFLWEAAGACVIAVSSAIPCSVKWPVGPGMRLL